MKAHDEMTPGQVRRELCTKWWKPTTSSCTTDEETNYFVVV